MENSKKPWELRSDDTRTEDKLPTFIIFTEDKVSERVYFKSFETNKVKVNVIGDQDSNITNVMNAIAHCKKEGLFDEKLQIWCVFDRDCEDALKKREKKDKKFEISLWIAEEFKIKVAWSNDCFELWVLLHFEDIDHTQPLLRDTYYQQLTKIMEADAKVCNDFSESIKKKHFYYKKDFKKEDNFKEYILPILQDETRRTTAIERAKELEKYHATRNVVPQEMCPCTMVHHLVKELLQYQ